MERRRQLLHEQHVGRAACERNLLDPAPDAVIY
jgi:hypothetical protein